MEEVEDNTTIMSFIFLSHPLSQRGQRIQKELEETFGTDNQTPIMRIRVGPMPVNFPEVQILRRVQENLISKGGVSGLHTELLNDHPRTATNSFISAGRRGDARSKKL